MGQRLAGGSRVGGGLAGGGEVGQLGAGLCVLIRDLLGDGTCRKGIHQMMKLNRLGKRAYIPPATES